MSDNFELELKQGFLEEASQLLVDAEQCFLILEGNPQDQPTLERIFRIAHNIKGSSKAVGFDELGAFTHEFESFLLKCKNGEIPITTHVANLLLKCTDHVNQFVQALKADISARVDSTDLISEIRNFKIEAAPPEAEIFPDEMPSPEEVSVLRASEEIPEDLPPAITPAVSPATHDEVAPVPKPAIASEPNRTAPPSDESIRVSLSRVEKLLNFVGEMVILQTVLKEQNQSGNPLLLRKTIDQMGKVTKEVQVLSMGLRMVPLKQTFQKMQRIVRDTSAILEKKVNLTLEGEETEVDKTVLEGLSDPLVHLVRNAVDHGIETPAVRLEKGKREVGTVTLRSYHQSGKLVIEVRDDGGGIPADRLRQKAIEKGILKANQQISDAEAIQLIFHPGFSTKAQVTEVSGRGVGMDVVKTNIEQMQGEVLVETTFGSGSVFKIILPLTLAIIDGMVVRSGEERFVVPLSHVHESVKVEGKDIQNCVGIGEVLILRGENLPVYRLAHALGRKAQAKAQASERAIAIIVRTQGKPFAALVDDIIGQQQVVIKKLGSEMQNIPGYSGSAILGDGHPALILELGDLVSKQTKLKAA